MFRRPSSTARRPQRTRRPPVLSLPLSSRRARCKRYVQALPRSLPSCSQPLFLAAPVLVAACQLPPAVLSLRSASVAPSPVTARLLQSDARAPLVALPPTYNTAASPRAPDASSTLNLSRRRDEGAPPASLLLPPPFQPVPRNFLGRTPSGPYRARLVAAAVVDRAMSSSPATVPTSSVGTPRTSCRASSRALLRARNVEADQPPSPPLTVSQTPSASTGCVGTQSPQLGPRCPSRRRSSCPRRAAVPAAPTSSSALRRCRRRPDPRSTAPAVLRLGRLPLPCPRARPSLICRPSATCALASVGVSVRSRPLVSPAPHPAAVKSPLPSTDLTPRLLLLRQSLPA